MKIAVIGASGFVGRNLYTKLKNQKKYTTVGTYFSHNAIPQLIQLDATSYNDVLTFCRTNTPNVVILANGIKDIRDCEIHKHLAQKNNVKPVSNFCDAITHLKLDCRVIYISTNYVFPSNTWRHLENDAPKPHTYYGVTKLMAEQLVTSYNNQRFCIVRTSSMIGLQSSFVQYVIESIVKKNTVTLSGSLMVSPTPSELFFLGIEYLLSNNPKGNIFHITSKESMTRYHLGVQIAKILQLPENAIQINEQPEQINLSNALLNPSEFMNSIESKSLEYYLYKSLR